ncbi:MAG: beta-glucosidase BglX [Paludibacteraceae bacterium]|nr:beta-glucosidase BglX [Paludibacteraceae bacterium]
MKKLVGFIVLVLWCVSCVQQPVTTPTNSIDAKVTALMEQMTWEEKIGQLHQVEGGQLTPQLYSEIAEGHVGSLLNCPKHLVNDVQRIAMQQSRLGIPLLIARDVIHGFKTIFPIPLGQAATFNPILVEKGAEIAATEASSEGIRLTFAPMIDITRDPRWGRIAESLGEDPYLTSVLGVAMVNGFQGNDLTQPNKVAACAKHFAAYGFSEGGRDYNIADVSEYQLREVILPPFKSVADAGVASFMPSFNEINGVPASANAYLFKQILRGEWGWKGTVISDYFSIKQIKTQGFCETEAQTAALAIETGIDVDMMSYVYHQYLDSLLMDGSVSEKAINDAVRNVLTLKYKLGLFDNPYVDTLAQPIHYDVSHLAVAKQAAIEGAVLLKNEHNLLPLSASQLNSVAIIGPMADAPAEQIGTWCFDAEPSRSITPLMAITKELQDGPIIHYVPGLNYSRDVNTNQIERAVSAAKKSDVVLLFVGEEAILSGEAKCRARLDLPGAQAQLVNAVAATGKPVVMVVMAGRPLCIGNEIANANAVLYTFHGGTMAGPAISDLLFGKSIPSGKLPVTIPQAEGQIPIYYYQKETGRPPHHFTLIDDIPVGAKQTSLGFCTYWLDAGIEPLYPFGFGLSYTQFTYSDIQVSQQNFSATDTLTVTCTITNTGKYNAYEVAQLYVHDPVASLTRPLKQLKGFQKVFIKAGEQEKVSFKLTNNDFAFWNNQNQFVAEPGAFTLYVAPSSDVAKGCSVSVVLE